ncbi:MAG TPA: aldo/keto reductase [Spirochaetota bacterium]|nr:aldo/keto reductase [Spirochaetota bacterium]
MNYRQLGKTGLSVTEIGCGGIPLQRLKHDQAAGLVQTAAERGVNFFDTSRVYTDSEAKIGSGLKQARQKVFIATKSYNRYKDGILNDIQVSLQKLQVNSIELYQLHNVSSMELLDKVMDPEQGALAGLETARQKGWIKNIGITGHKIEVLKEALKRYDFATVQFPFNAVERENEDFIRKCAARNTGVIIMKPLAGGSLKPALTALNFILRYPVSCVIPGMQSIKELNENIQADGKIEPEAERVLLEQAASLGSHFCRRCEYCIPACPRGINITMIQLLHLYYKNYKLHAWARARYASLKVNAADCEECGECEKHCPYDLPVRQMLKDAHRDLG